MDVFPHVRLGRWPPYSKVMAQVEGIIVVIIIIVVLQNPVTNFKTLKLIMKQFFHVESEFTVT